MPPRPTSARPPVVVSPLLISQLNCEPLCGIDARRFLELLPRLNVTVAKIGKLRLVDADSLRSSILAQTSCAPSRDAVDLARQPETVDEVLAMLGLRRKS